MSKQSEFEEYKDKCLVSYPYRGSSYDKGLMNGMDLARDWILNKAKELSLDVYNYDCKMLPLHKLEKACK